MLRTGKCRKAAAFILLLTGIFLCCTLFFSGAAESLPYQNYSYDKYRKALPAPAAYASSRRIDATWMGLDTPLNDPKDFCWSEEGYLYIADTGNNRIVRLDGDFRLVAQLTELDLPEGADPDAPRQLNSPNGVTVDREGNLYVADTENNRVVKLTPELDTLAVFPLNAEDSPLLTGTTDEGFVYLPLKIAVDNAMNMYVVSRGVNQGLMEFTPEGEFIGCIGAPRVSYGFVQILQRFFMTEAQLSRLPTIVPTEFSNVAVDSQGFLYSTIRTISDAQAYVAYSDNQDEWASQAPVMRFNATGIDVLNRTGIVPPYGDFLYDNPDGTSGPSRMIDVSVAEHGIYSLLDITRGRVFTYDEDGNLMYVFGGLGRQVGLFTQPSALERVGDDMLVLDRGGEPGTGSFTVFSRTEYGDAIVEAITLFNGGKYDASVEQWEKVLQLNSNYQPAYVGIGKNYLRNNEYEQAVEYLSIAEETTYRSKAFGYYRDNLLYENIGWVFLALAIVACGAATLVILTKKRARAGIVTEKYTETVPGGLRYAFYIMFHPFKGFWDLKIHRRKKVIPCLIFVALMVISLVVNSLYRGVFLDPVKPGEYNIFTDVITVLLPLGLWCVSSWCFTSLMDGKGTLGDIFISTCYALVPMILVYIPLTIISNVTTLEELAVYHVVMAFAAIWTGCLVIFGLMITNDYSLSKTVMTCLLSIAGIGVILFLGLVAFSVVQQMAGFVIMIYREITFRI